MPKKINSNSGKKTSRNRGKKSEKDEVKYTFWRNKEDLKKLEELRKVLKAERITIVGFYNFNTDSEIYRRLPDLYLNAVKTIGELHVAIDELTAKNRRLEDLRMHFCRIFEICSTSDVEDGSDQIKKSMVKICDNFDIDDHECQLSSDRCDGYNINCEDYEPTEEEG